MSILLLLCLYLSVVSADKYSATFQGSCQPDTGCSCLFKDPGSVPDPKVAGTKYNFLMVMVDQQRHSPYYEDPAVKSYLENLPGRKFIRTHGTHFVRHYVATVACSPSRASIFTGHYPSLHGVAQVDGVGKSADDEGISWLGEATVPTVARYFEALGYNVIYKGKWHISHRDIVIPGKSTSIISLDTEGNPFRLAVEIYRRANLLSAYGFQGWIGNEPHGSNPANTGCLRDPAYTFDIITQLNSMETNPQAEPFFFVASYVNPHDISVWPGLNVPQFLASANASLNVPPVPNPPTLLDDLTTKPACQKSFNTTWRIALPVGPFQVGPMYTYPYYQLQAFVDTYINLVMQRFRFSRFYNNTVIVHLADHGEMLRAHGGLVEKWHCGYEEAIHVDLYIANRFFPVQQTPDALFTTHVDIVPTLLGLAGADCQTRENIRKNLHLFHTEAQELVGYDHSDFVKTGSGNPTQCKSGVRTPVSVPTVAYSFSDDDPTRGDQQRAAGYAPTVQPNAWESITGWVNQAVWKLVFYHDGTMLKTTALNRVNMLYMHQTNASFANNTDWELYNLNTDPGEMTNLLYNVPGTGFDKCAALSGDTATACNTTMNWLVSQRQARALVPQFQNNPRCFSLICGDIVLS